jgi:hypothetical protein
MRKTYQQKSAEYAALALAHCQTLQAGKKTKVVLPTIKLGSPEWKAWERYFRDFLGFEPALMKIIRSEGNPDREFTVPAQWPEWFDAGYGDGRKAEA